MRFDKLQHIYDKHAADFGIRGPKNAERLQMLRQALQDHLENNRTVRVNGCYRGQQALLCYNSRSRNVVVLGPGGEVVAAYRTSDAQAAYIQSTGRLN